MWGCTNSGVFYFSSVIWLRCEIYRATAGISAIFAPTEQCSEDYFYNLLKIAGESKNKTCSLTLIKWLFFSLSPFLCFIPIPCQFLKNPALTEIFLWSIFERKHRLLFIGKNQISTDLKPLIQVLVNSKIGFKRDF